MEFEDAKENIQPLASGRNASILQASLRVESTQELHMQRRQLEDAIGSYTGDDPLEPWYTYISWIEQSFPSGGKESGLDEVLCKCLQRFESESRYYQDRRMIGLYMKFIDSHKNPTECYQQLFNAGIGTMVADFYICWAYYYDLSGNTRKADEIFRRGIACRAEPLDDLKEAHMHFGFSVAQRLMYQDDENAKEDANRQLHERRMALTSLRGHRRKATVGSIRTGQAVKNVVPGKLQLEVPTTSSRCNAKVRVFKDENENPNSLPKEENQVIQGAAEVEEEKSVIRSIIDKAREQENLIEPGPWNKAYKKKTGKLFSGGTHKELDFNIHVDNAAANDTKLQQTLNLPIKGEINIDKPFKYPPNFCSQNRPQPEWNLPVTTENEPDPRAFPKYNKCFLYPRPNIEFQPEEFRAYHEFKRRGITNEFTKKMDNLWSVGDVNANMRQYPNFAKQSRPRKIEEIDLYFEPPKKPELGALFDQIYNSKLKEEFQIEELMAQNMRRNETIIQATDMEETVCLPSELVQRRKSFFPVRKSIASWTLERPVASAVSKHKCDEAESPAIPKKSTIENFSKLQISEVQHAIDKKMDQSDLDENKIAIFQPSTPKVDASVELPCTSTAAAGAKAALSFDIYQDPTQTISNAMLVHKNNKPSKLDDDFAFKAPVPPIASKPVKMSFEIFEEEKVENAGAFDAEETCSTQMFNIFLKSQPMSTPKPLKVPSRQFGTVLREIVPTPTSAPNDSPGDSENISDIECITAKADTSLGGDTAQSASQPAFSSISPYSPPQTKQLSTILETSEHATTQGTHTTGASTKSTISSPENDIDPIAANLVRSAAPYTNLETVEENSHESSASKTDKSVKTDDTHKLCDQASSIVNSYNKSVSRVQTKTDISVVNAPATPGLMRFQADLATPLSIFKSLHDASATKGAGNFTRLENKEDTLNQLPMASLRFQEDKTETITRTLFTSRLDGKFQDDKTETISKMLFTSRQDCQLQDSKCHNVSSVVGPAPKMPTCTDLLGSDDSFKLFCESPPQIGVISKKIVPPSSMVTPSVSDGGGSGSGRVCLTPMMRQTAKRMCQQNTPVMGMLGQRKGMPILKFEDELQAASEATPIKTTIVDCSLQLDDLSFVRPTQEAVAVNKGSAAAHKNIDKDTTKSKMMPTLTDSLMANESSSFVLPTQPAASFRKTAPAAKDNSSQAILRDSFLSDFSCITETQPESSVKIANSKMREPENNQMPPQEDKMVQQSMMLETFMRDFSVADNASKFHSSHTSVMQTGRNTSLKFLSESAMLQQTNISLGVTEPTTKLRQSSNLKFLSESLCAKKQEPNAINQSKVMETLRAPAYPSTEQFFELNAETEMFATNISSIKNSTWLPHCTQISQDLSLSSKTEATNASISKTGNNSVTTAEVASRIPKPMVPNCRSHSITADADVSGKMSAIHQPTILLDASIPSTSLDIEDIQPAIMTKEQDEMSIYYAKTPRTPKIQDVGWDESLKEGLSSSQNSYVHQRIDLNATNQVIDNICLDTKVNPFNMDLKSALLDQVDFVTYLQELPTCKLTGKVSCLQPHSVIEVHDAIFEVLKAIGQGAYGAVYVGKDKRTGQKCALKQERPPNHWELYICLEVQARLRADDMLPAFMHVDYALIGNNASILISSYSPHGSLINVCNKFKKCNNKNVDEYVVMLLTCELLEIVDHLHSVEIIHADLKPDNFLLMSHLTYPTPGHWLQLIDFGISIDMQRFKKGQTFTYVNESNEFQCVEMRENRPWTYQLDLFGLAGVIHVLLFGKYMAIEKRSNGIWMHKTRLPRYFNKVLWDTIFQTLLNVRDCNSMPNLQSLRTLLKEELVERERYITTKVAEFNMALQS